MNYEKNRVVTFMWMNEISRQRFTLQFHNFIISLETEEIIHYVLYCMKISWDKNFAIIFILFS